MLKSRTSEQTGFFNAVFRILIVLIVAEPVEKGTTAVDETKTKNRNTFSADKESIVAGASQKPSHGFFLRQVATTMLRPLQRRADRAQHINRGTLSRFSSVYPVKGDAHGPAGPRGNRGVFRDMGRAA